MNMKNWLKTAAGQKKSMPILSFPGIQLINISVSKMVNSGKLQAKCMEAIANRYDTLAAVTLMDLSVEAEAFGSPIRFSEDEVPTVTGAIVKDKDSADALLIPKVGEKRTGEYIKTVEYAKKLIQDRPIFAGAIGPFSLSGRLMDMTEIMVNCYEEPTMVHTVLEKATVFLIGYINAFKAAGANGIVLAEPAAGLLSPDLFAEFSSPYVKRIIEAVEDDDFIVIYHNCGNVIPLMTSILSQGSRVLHFGNAIDLSAALNIVPNDIIVMGNVEPAGQFRNGTVESITNATLKVLNNCAKYPNFVLSSGCDIPPVSPLKNIDAFFQAAKSFYEECDKQ